MKSKRPIDKVRDAEIAIAKARRQYLEPPPEAASIPPLKLRVPVSPNDGQLLRREIRERRTMGQTQGVISFTEFLDYLEFYERMK